MEIAIILILVVICSAGIFFVVQNNQQKAEAGSTDNLNRRIAILQDGFQDQGFLESRDSSVKGGESLWQDFMNLIGTIAPVPSPEKLEALNKAGYRTPNAHIVLFVQQISGALSGGLLAGVATLMISHDMLYTLLATLLVGLLGFMGPQSNLRKKTAERSLMIDKTLPDMIDLFANCCIAGVSFDTAAGYILNDLGDDPVLQPIREDFLAWQADVNLGIQRPDCWNKLSNRSDSKNIRYFTSLMNQSEKTGGSIADSLFKMSSFFRDRRKQQIQAEIAQLAQKMSMQTMAFIILPIIILLMGPIFLNAAQMAGQLFR